MIILHTCARILPYIHAHTYYIHGHAARVLHTCTHITYGSYLHAHAYGTYGTYSLAHAYSTYSLEHAYGTYSLSCIRYILT